MSPIPKPEELVHRLKARPCPCQAWRGLALAALLCLAPFWAKAAGASAAFEAANRLYEEGKFRDAATAYEALEQGREVSAALLFNLGNARFKSGQIGQAIVAYRQAARLIPRDPDVRANLQFARNRVQGPRLQPSVWENWLTRLTLNEWALLAGGMVWALFLMLALRQWRPALRPALRNPILTAAVAVVLLGGCLAAALTLGEPQRIAVVVATEAAMRHGPLEESPGAFTARDGAELRILDQKGDWLYVTDGRGHTGWIRREQARVI